MWNLKQNTAINQIRIKWNFPQGIRGNPNLKSSRPEFWVSVPLQERFSKTKSWSEHNRSKSFAYNCNTAILVLKDLMVNLFGARNWSYTDWLVNEKSLLLILKPNHRYSHKSKRFFLRCVANYFGALKVPTHSAHSFAAEFA